MQINLLINANSSLKIINKLLHLKINVSSSVPHCSTDTVDSHLNGSALGVCPLHRLTMGEELQHGGICRVKK